jgi:hypothetical protein
MDKVMKLLGLGAVAVLLAAPASAAVGVRAGISYMTGDAVNDMAYAMGSSAPFQEVITPVQEFGLIVGGPAGFQYGIFTAHTAMDLGSSSLLHVLGAGADIRRQFPGGVEVGVSGGRGSTYGYGMNELRNFYLLLFSVGLRIPGTPIAASIARDFIFPGIDYTSHKNPALITRIGLTFSSDLGR